MRLSTTALLALSLLTACIQWPEAPPPRRQLDQGISEEPAEERSQPLDASVAALIAALRQGDPETKRSAADALARLGPGAEAALPALLDQFAHEYPWVRVSCQAAVGAMGAKAVPKLVEKFESSTGGPRVRAAFVLGGIGPEAKGAVPALERAMREDTPSMQARFAGILHQIDPQRFPSPTGSSPHRSTSLARFERGDTAAPPRVDTKDWPQFHGPTRDAICYETGLLEEWPEGGPKLAWKTEGLGRGYSSVAIVGDRLFTMGDREVEGKDAQLVLAIDLTTREEAWATRIGPPHLDGGPRSTPTVVEGLVYALGTDADLVCLDAKSGDLRWKKSLAKDFGAKCMSVWKFCESPLVDGDRVIVTPGGPEAALVALDRKTGELRWKSKMPELGDKGSDGTGYSSVVAATIHGVPQYVQLLGRGVIGVEAATGRFLWGYNRVANNVANITAPVVHGNHVFASTAYNTGSALLEIVRNGEDFEAREVYFLKAKDFQNHHGGIILRGDHIYGGHGSNKGDPACIELATGKVVWKERAPAKGSAAVIYADGHLIFRYDRGDVVLIEATPKELLIKGRFEPVKGKGPAWAHPVVNRGRLYLRHADVLACYDLRGK